jgi:DNA-binding CsgD family transcriptional regulator/transcriptional regulator with GAF, ATPase, and Fis domain
MILPVDYYKQIENLLFEGSASSQIWDEIAHVLQNLIPFDRMVIASVDVPRDVFSPLQISGNSVRNWDATPGQRMGETLIGEAVKSVIPVTSMKIVEHYGDHDDTESTSAPTVYWSSALGMRIVSSGEIVGAIVFLSHTPDIFSSDKLLQIENISRVLAPYLSQHKLQKEASRATEHQANLERLLRQLNDTQDPSIFFNMFYSTFAARASLVYGALLSYDRYSDDYVLIADIDGGSEVDKSILEHTTKILSTHRVTGDSVYLACRHKAVPTSNMGTDLVGLVSQYPEFRELCIIPLMAGTNRVGAILFAMSDCNPSMLERMQEIGSAGPMASAFLQIHQTSRQWDRQQHISTVLQYAVESLCETPGSSQKLEVFQDVMTRSLGASQYSFEITHRVTGGSLIKINYPSESTYDDSALLSSKQSRVSARLGNTHMIDVVASFDPETRPSSQHESRAIVSVCASILGTELLKDSSGIRAAKLPNQNDQKFPDTIADSITAYDLTPRETEILAFLSYGATNDEIAVNCGLASGTVKNRLVSIYKKLGVRNRSEASILSLGFDHANMPMR